MKHLMVAVLVLLLVMVSGAQAQSDQDAYQEARRSLNRQEFSDAITGFQAFRAAFPESEYVADSYYWEAFSLERSDNLEVAVEVLDVQIDEHPEATISGDSRALRLRICGELASRGDRECAESITTMVRAGDQADDATRLAALNALLSMRSERAVPLATQLLANRDQSARMRMQALFIIADQADEIEARDILLRTALDETDETQVRAQAVFWLSEVPGEATVDALARLAQGSVAREIKDKAVFALSQHDSEAAMGFLRQVVADDESDIELRKQAIFWLGQEGEESELPFLLQLYAELTDTELKQQILFSVSQVGSEEASQWLSALAMDAAEPIDVRKQALFWAADAGLSVADMESLYASSEEMEIREHLIWLIGKEGGEASFDSLVEIATTDGNVRLREQAIFWLGDSNDPRAEAYLLELIGQQIQ